MLARCSTIQMVIAPIHRAVGIKRIVVSTPVGLGPGGDERFERQVRQYAAGEPVEFDPNIFDKPIFDCLPRDAFLRTGHPGRDEDGQ